MDVREVERVDGRRIISGIRADVEKRHAMAMKDRKLVAAGVVAVIAAVCCTAPLLVTTVGAVGFTAWLAMAGNALIPALILCVGLIGFSLYRKQRRER